MSFISAGNTTTTTLVVNGDTTGNLVFNTGGANTTALTITNAQNATFANAVTVTGTLTATGGVVQGSNAAPTFAAYQSSAQSIINATFTKLNFQTKEWDTASAFDSTTNYRFTPLVAGYYQVNGLATIPQTINNTAIEVAIYKNGSIYKDGASGTSNTAFYGRGNISALVYLNGSTDYIELWVYQGMGATYSLLQGINSTYFQAAFVRSA